MAALISLVRPTSGDHFQGPVPRLHEGVVTLIVACSSMGEVQYIPWNKLTLLTAHKWSSSTVQIPARVT